VALTTPGAATAATAPAADEEPEVIEPVLPWSLTVGAATAEGERWRERRTTVPYRSTVVRGTLTNTGADCYAVWYRYTYSFSPSFPSHAKIAEICGPGSVAVDLRFSSIVFYNALTVCSGTENRQDCDDWEKLGVWPASS
jgi:hypothetical protein